MIPARFDYVRAASAEEAISLIGEHGDEAKFLAGGHSLLPLMKLRLAQPTVLVDIGRLQRPVATSATPATTSPSARSPATMDLETSDLLAAARAAAGATPPARSATRRCATAARSAARSPTPTRRRDLPATTLALGATYVAQGPNGTREIAAADFYAGLPRVGAGSRRAAHRDPRAEDGRRRLELPEVQPPGPGLGDRRRRRLAPQRRQPASASSTWARRRSSPRASRRRWRGGASIADAAEQADAEAEPQSRPQRQRRVPQAPRQGPHPPRPGAGERRLIRRPPPRSGHSPSHMTSGHRRSRYRERG